jgi:hypothetical protein
VFSVLVTSIWPKLALYYMVRRSNPPRVAPTTAVKKKISRTHLRVDRAAGLRERAVGGRARRRYDRGVAAFVEWCFVSNKRTLAFLVESGKYLDDANIRELDFVLTEYFLLAYDADPVHIDEAPGSIRITSRWEGSELLCGITDKFPEARKKLPRASRTLGSWLREEVPLRAPPLPVSFAYAILGWAFSRGLLSFACGIITMFWAMLRPCEFFALHIDQLVHGTNDSPSFITILHSKTSVAKGSPEVATIRDPQLVRLLRSSAPTFGLVWPQTPTDFRDLFRRATADLGLVVNDFRLYSLRRGGASFFFARIPMDELIIRGRWQSMKTARVYIEGGAAELAAQLARTNSLVARYHSIISKRLA